MVDLGRCRCWAVKLLVGLRVAQKAVQVRGPDCREGKAAVVDASAPSEWTVHVIDRFTMPAPRRPTATAAN